MEDPTMEDPNADLPVPGPGTRAVWAGEEWSDDAPPSGSPTQVPVVHSVSFGYRDLESWSEVARGERRGHIYGRNTNPTVAVFEEKVRQLEGALIKLLAYSSLTRREINLELAREALGQDEEEEEEETLPSAEEIRELEARIADLQAAAGRWVTERHLRQRHFANGTD